MGIPTVTGIRDLPSRMRDGDFVIVDGSAGEVRVNPDERVRAEYEASAERFKAARATPPEAVEHCTRDGHRVQLLGSCGNLGEVELARSFGMDGVGLFRTELLFLAEKALPTEDMLERHYRQVVQQAAGVAVNFRLLDISTRVQIGGETPRIERNPALGMRGVRRLLHEGLILRLQIRAVLRAAEGTETTGLLVPFVTALSDLQRVKAAILEERVGLRKRGLPCADVLRVAPIIEVPAAAFVLGGFLHESDFVVVAIDDLQAYLLAADRDSAEVRDYYQSLHPAVFEMLARLAREARRRRRDLILFGESAADPMRVPFYVGVGIRHFSVAPARLPQILRSLRRFTQPECARIAASVLEAPRAIDVQRVLVQLQGAD
jgi:phosphotransferase system enzyme I (PtsI)